MSARPWWPPAVVGGLALVLWLSPPASQDDEQTHDGAAEEEASWWPVPPMARSANHAPSPGPPTAVAIAIFGGNTIDDVILDGWTIHGIAGPDPDGGFALDVEKSRTKLTLRVMPIDTMPYGPPVRTEAFDYFYDSLAPDAELDDGDVVELLKALSKIVEGRESD